VISNHVQGELEGDQRKYFRRHETRAMSSKFNLTKGLEPDRVTHSKVKSMEHLYNLHAPWMCVYV
jgi:hypothetical protein